MVAGLLFAGLGIALALNAASLAFKLWQTRSESAAAWEERAGEASAQVDGLDERAFRRAYYRAYGPRGSVHALAALAVAAALTAPALLALGGLWRLGWDLAGQPPMYDPGTLIWMFFLFFGLIAAWTSVAAIAMQRYHRNRPRELAFELARERDRAARANAPPDASRDAAPQKG